MKRRKKKVFVFMIFTFIGISVMVKLAVKNHQSEEPILDAKTLKSLDSFNATIDSFHERTPGIRFVKVPEKE